MKILTILRCPICGFACEEYMPTDTCLIRYQCHSCGAMLQPKVGDCCLFCSYGDDTCPPMQAEIAEPQSRHLPKVSVGRPPPRHLSDDVVRLRLPTLADIERVIHQYDTDPLYLEGIWLPGPQPGQPTRAWATALVQEFCAGWTTMGGLYGGGLVVDAHAPFVGIVYVVPTNTGVVELSYGVAPAARGRGIAVRAARLTADWLLMEAGAERVELRIDTAHHVSRRVAEKAGFRFVNHVLTSIVGTGQTAEDVIYVRMKHDTS